MNKYIPTSLGVIILILIAVIIAGAFYFFGQKDNPFSTPISSPIAPVKNDSKACTEEAKICPDGSAVGRTGPNCEFAACPEGVKNSICKNLCGNGTCQERVCMGTGCACAETAESCPQDCVISSDLIYKNTDYGFQVTLPKGWEKYQVSIQRDKGDDNHTYFYFILPTSDKSWLGSYDKNTGKAIPGVVDIFVITATDLATWNKDLNSTECKENPNPSCPYEGSVVAKNNQYVFDAGYGNGLLPPDVEKFRSAKSAQEFLTGKFKLLP